MAKNGLGTRLSKSQVSVYIGSDGVIEFLCHNMTYYYKITKVSHQTYFARVNPGPPRSPAPLSSIAEIHHKRQEVDKSADETKQRLKVMQLKLNQVTQIFPYITL